jgi:hypothetical protein
MSDIAQHRLTEAEFNEAKARGEILRWHAQDAGSKLLSCKHYQFAAVKGYWTRDELAKPAPHWLTREEFNDFASRAGKSLHCFTFDGSESPVFLTATGVSGSDRSVWYLRCRDGYSRAYQWKPNAWQLAEEQGAPAAVQPPGTETPTPASTERLRLSAKAPTRNPHVGDDLCGHEQPSGLPCLQARGHEGGHDFEPKAGPGPDPYEVHRVGLGRTKGKTGEYIEWYGGGSLSAVQGTGLGRAKPRCRKCGCEQAGHATAFDPSLGHNVKACCKICGGAW